MGFATRPTRVRSESVRIRTSKDSQREKLALIFPWVRHQIWVGSPSPQEVLRSDRLETALRRGESGGLSARNTRKSRQNVTLPTTWNPHSLKGRSNVRAQNFLNGNPYVSELAFQAALKCSELVQFWKTFSQPALSGSFWLSSSLRSRYTFSIS